MANMERPPKGEWTQLVGESYDRTIHGFEVVSTTDEDERFIALFNDKRNEGHFNIFAHNCADFFARGAQHLPARCDPSQHRGDLGMTSPKQVARSLVQ